MEERPLATHLETNSTVQQSQLVCVLAMQISIHTMYVAVSTSRHLLSAMQDYADTVATPQH